MRADDIRALVIEANEKALAACEKLEADGSISGHEAADYHAAIVGLLRFWETASPAFCFAWFALVSKEADG